MFKNYLKIACRNLIRHKAYSTLNIAGLAIGMSASILIFLWVQNEVSYDRFNANAAQLYRLTASAGDFKAAVSPAGMAEGLQAQLPEIKAAVRLSKPVTTLLQVGDKKFEEKNGFYADSNFLQVFTYTLAQGNAATALQRPDGILISAAMAKKYFGDENALGKILKKDNSENCVVTGILAPVPVNSHLQFDYIFPISAIENTNWDLKNKVWGNFNYYTYLQLGKGFTASATNLHNLETRIKQIQVSHAPGGKIDFHLQPLTEIHLHSNLQIDLPGHGNIQYVNAFFIVAIVILIVACINFMNLATARSARRAKEVGLRKVVGAARYQLILQFLGESLVISLFSLLVAVAIVFMVLPAFNDIAGKELNLNLLDIKLWAGMLLIATVTGLVAGSYPALFLSAFKPVSVLKGKLKIAGGNTLFRNGLVVTQFAAAIMLLVGTAVVYKQLNFIKDKDLGFEKANLLYMPITGDMANKRAALTTALQQNTLTSDFSIISDLPNNLVTGTLDVTWEGRDPKSQLVIPSIDVDENFIHVFKMQVINGRGFSKEFKGDSSNYVVNEKMLQVMGLTVQNAIGKTITFSGTKGNIIGVVKDFNFKPLQYAIDPLVLRLSREEWVLCVRTPAGKTAESIKALEQVNAKLNPAYPLSYNFIDQELANNYKGEQQMGSIFNLFAILAIFISGLGLYGLSAFMAEQRTKEIGVRKVLGASVTNIVYLLSTGFTRLVLVAIVIAVPLSWLMINKWLDTFAYHAHISWAVFALASLATLLIAWLTVSYESIKAAVTNPVKSLKTE